MIRYYKLQEMNRKFDMELRLAISEHSADMLVSYKQIQGENLWLGYYFPYDYDHEKHYPTIIMIHGGGWSGRKIFEDQNGTWQGDYLGYLARYYAMKGLVAVSVDYRLIRGKGQEKDYGIAEAIEDCYDAMNFILDNADRYGINVNSMYLLGESAGGHLAGALITTDVKQCFRFRKAMLVNPITDLFLEEWGKNVPLHNENKQLSEMTYEQKLQFLSPLYRIDDMVCDVVLIHGEADTTVSPEHSRRFYCRMQEKSKCCELHLLENTKHAFLLPEYYKYGWEACQTAIGIIDAVITDT